MPPKKKRIRKRKKKRNYSKCEELRIMSPYNNLIHKTRIDNVKQRNEMFHHEIYKSSGLSSKERNYIVCSCQRRSSRYINLKRMAADAIREGKIFSVYGYCKAVRTALVERGWVEKIPPHRMNLRKIRSGAYSTKASLSELERLLLSNLVEKCNPNFIWLTQEEFLINTSIDMEQDGNTMINRLKLDATWTTKQGLCCSIKRNHWFHIEDIAEVIAPRTYNTYDTGEIEGFINDFKITACTSLLKWIISIIANKKHIFVETGTIPMKVLVFALNRCMEYLYKKQNNDIDRPVGNVSTGQWNAFLKKYYRIIAKDDVFEADKENKLPLYLSYAKFLLKEIYKYRPQLNCEGCHDIWIIKPAHCSRGRGIRLASKLGVITNLVTKANAKYVLQKYIEEPLLIYETKFDIRQYYLVTSTYPLVIWMYKDCYLKFSSQKYNIKKYDESIHLTNNAVQRKYKNCTERHSELPQHNMWSLDTYKDHLNRIGKYKVWDNIIYPGMKKSIIGIMLTSQDSLSISKNCFELYGCDFLLDKEYTPWLIEINSCPDLKHTTQVTAKICPEVVADIIKVVIDYAADPRAPTGNFECVYRQSMIVTRYNPTTDLAIRGYALPNDYFYKGNIELMGSVENSQQDIKAKLNKIKEVYDTDLMVELEEDYDVNKNNTGSKQLINEDELDVAASIIIEQLDKILEKVDSEHNFRSCLSRRQISFLEDKLTENIHSVKSITEINTLLKKSIARYKSPEHESLKHRYNFSTLDNGILSKLSYLDIDPIKLDPIEKIFYYLSLKIFEEKSTLREICTPESAFITHTNVRNNFINATRNILNFIKQKQAECLQ